MSLPNPSETSKQAEPEEDFEETDLQEAEEESLTPPLPLLPPSALLKDAPISHFLSLRFNPRVAEMPPDELRAYVQELRMLATQQPTQTSKLLKESNEIKERTPRKASAKQIKINNLLMED